MLARGSQGGRIVVGRADRDAILRALLAAPGSTDADGRRGAGRRGGRGDARPRSRPGTFGERREVRGRRRRWRRARGRAPTRAERRRRAGSRRGGGRVVRDVRARPPRRRRRAAGRAAREGATAALHQHRGGAACAMPRSAPSPGADHFCPPKGGHSTRWGEWVPPTALDSRNRRRNLQLGDARQSQTGGRPVLAWTRERFRESRVESGVSKLARGRRYPNTRGRDARVTFAGIMADTPYVSEFRRRTLRLPRARVLDARRRWRKSRKFDGPRTRTLG